MKVAGLTRISQEEIQRLPDASRKAVEAIVGPFNTMVTSVGQALQSGLTLHENYFGFEIFQSFTNEIEKPFLPDLLRWKGIRVRGIQVLDTGGEMLLGFKLTRKTNGMIGITLKFDGASDLKSDCRIFVHMG